MTAEVFGYDGSRAALPTVRYWKMEYGTGTPCDSFELECFWDGEAPEDMMHKGTRLIAGWDGERVFTGVVDEFEYRVDERGGSLTVSGRGMAALLLDNEAPARQYQVATVQDILRDHVAPYGITVGERGDLPPVYGFQVEGGSSEWQVLDDFARKHGGVTPRFDREGRLVLSPWRDGERKVIEPADGVLEVRWGERRYGVLSEVLVRNPGIRNGEQMVVNEEFRREGGRCRRVLTMPRKSGYRAMQCSGEYQIKRSMAERRWAAVKLCGVFRAWPGERISVRLERPKLTGEWRVAGVVTGVDRDGGYTVLKLQAPEVS